MKSALRGARRQILRWLVRVRRHVPPGLRLVVGLLLIVGGVFGFLPVLGFWMIPLGLAVVALDVRAFLEWLTGRRVRCGLRRPGGRRTRLDGGPRAGGGRHGEDRQGEDRQGEASASDDR